MNTALNETLAALPNDTKVYVSTLLWMFAEACTKKTKPGHEYTKQNVKFLTTVLKTEPVKKLQSFAENNQQTQGKFTIGDEKVLSWFEVLDKRELIKLAIQRIHESRRESSWTATEYRKKLIPSGPHRAEGNRQDGCCRCDGEVERDEKQHVNRVSSSSTLF